RLLKSRRECENYCNVLEYGARDHGLPANSRTASAMKLVGERGQDWIACERIGAVGKNPSVPLGNASNELRRSSTATPPHPEKPAHARQHSSATTFSAPRPRQALRSGVACLVLEAALAASMNRCHRSAMRSHWARPARSFVFRVVRRHSSARFR